MILNKMMIAVVGLSILSAPVAHSGFMDFAKRGFKSCTDNCTTNVCGDKEKRAWCVKNCSYMKGDNIKIDMIQVCKTYDLKSGYNPNKPYSEVEKKYFKDMKEQTNDVILPSKSTNKTNRDHLADYYNSVQNMPEN